MVRDAAGDSRPWACIWVACGALWGTSGWATGVVLVCGRPRRSRGSAGRSLLSRCTSLIHNGECQGFEWDRPTGQGLPLHERQDAQELHCDTPRPQIQVHRYRCNDLRPFYFSTSRRSYGDMFFQSIVSRCVKFQSVMNLKFSHYPFLIDSYCAFS